ncbi:PAS domain S-box protein [Methylomonas rivi]|uniref:histidine kinase n=1 Tax=Methylomonas rivi TaxID=2952226 RepID=A0ABT1U8B8_9GAMM|nr:PAS domain S-box protein [Methylomonas sp. WSC-6]MCQ8130103.1 PAS domain S-box protein [Methylomonas sp. WSC-6]
MQSHSRFTTILSLLGSVIIPVLAAWIQFDFFKDGPRWLLFYPSVFVSAWLAGMPGGIIATILSTLLGVYYFYPPYQSFEITDEKYLPSILIFGLMGILFGVVFERLKRNQAALALLAEQTAQTDQERLALALASSHAGLWEWELASNRVTWSDSLRQLYGVEPSLPSSYENWASTVHPGDLANVESELWEAVRHEREFNLEWRVANRADSQPRWLVSNGKPQRDAQGKMVSYRGIVLDISEQRLHEQSLRDSERNFRLLAEAMPQIVWITDADGRNIFLNQQWVNYTGLPLEESYGDNWIVPFHPDDQKTIWSGWQHAVHHQTEYSVECRIRRQDGEYRWWLIRGVPVRNEYGETEKWFGTCTDIHDLKITGLALQESEQRYRQLFEANPLPVWLCDPQTGAILDANQATTACYGYSHAELLEMKCKELALPNEPHDKFFEQTSPTTTLLGEAINHLGVRQHRRKDGGKIWVEQFQHALPLQDRCIEVMLARDISAQIQAEQKLQESEARWQFALEGSDLGVWDWNIANGEVFFSKVWKSMLGCDENEIPNCFEGWQTRIHPDDVDRVSETLEHYFQGKTPIYQLEHRLRHLDGGYRWILARGIVITRNAAGKPLRMIGTHQDITDNKQIQDALQKSRSQLSLFIKHAPAALAMFDRDMRYLAASNRWLEDYHLQGQDIIGRCHYEVFPEIGENWKQIHRRALAGEVVKNDADCFVRSDGTQQWLRWEVRPWRTQQDQVGGIAIFAEDISQRKRNEHELRQHRYHLQELVDERTAELEQARREAERLALAKSGFLANMSHEIRTPMNAVLGFCHLLQQRPLDRDSLALVLKIHDAGQNLLGIINDILDFSKIEAGKTDIENAPFRLSELLDGLAALMMTLARNKHLELIITPPKSLEKLWGDRQHLQQVLTNLLSNAIKFTDRGEVELHIEIVPAEDGLEYLHFLVRDTGIGIPREKQEEIFAVFSQADSSITRRFGGSGLGLAISRQLVELMGGTLQLTSEEGVGSRFSFQLPLQRVEESPPSAARLAALRILVADDSATARAALTNTIHRLGWQADTADSGESALAAISTRQEPAIVYDAVLLDWQMPGLDGLATARMLREHFAQQRNTSGTHPILVMVTAADRETVLALPDSRHVDAVLNKPLTASVLYNTLAEFISPLQSRRQTQASTLPDPSMPAITGVRVLVVDDSEINREVAHLTLASYGALVELAGNGQEALDWLKDHPFAVDIVLMDVQMPVMDGYTATRILREDPRWQTLPIVALSAGVFKEDVELAKAAGMDDFISKPFNLGQLLTTIQRLASGRQIEAEAQSDAILTGQDAQNRPTASADAEELPDIAIDEALKQWGEAEIYGNYLRHFVENYASCGTRIAELLAGHDELAAATLSHKLKGAAATLGLKKAAHSAQMLEAALKRGVFNEELLESLQTALDQACQAVETWLNSSEKPPVPSADLLGAASPEQLIDLLKQLLEALDEDNPAVAKPVLSKLQHKIPEALFAELQAKLTVYDFRGAEALAQIHLNQLQSDVQSK